MPDLTRPAASPRRWAPPALSSPTVVTIDPEAYDPKVFAPDEDVVVKLPPVLCKRGVDITGGRRVEIIGGAVKPSVNAAGIRLKEVTGSIFLEGLGIDMRDVSNDAIAVSSVGSHRPDVYLQNIRATGVNGSFAGTHADLFQHQGNIGRVFVHGFTGRSNYQGFFVPSQFSIAGLDLDQVDLGYEPGGDAYSYLLWLRDNAADLAYPVRLSEVYVAPRAGQTLGANAVWPDSAQGGGIGAIVQPDGSVRWGGTMRVSGAVRPGRPAGGDFVPASAVGIGYVSPGYERHAPEVAGGDDAFGVCRTLDPWLINTVGAISGANRTHYMRLRGRKPRATRVRIGVGAASGNIAVGIYANNGRPGRDAAPAGPAKALVGPVAMSALLQDDGSAIGANTTVLIPLATPVDVEEGDWIGISLDNATATLSRSASPTHSAMLKGSMAAQANAFPAPETPAALFQSTPYLYAAVE